MSIAGQRRFGSAKDVFDPLEERLFGLRILLAARRLLDLRRQDLAQLFDGLALFARQLLRDRDFHGHVHVAAAATGDAWHPFAAQAEARSAGGAFRDRDRLLGIERRHFHAAAQRQGGEADADFAIQVVVFTPEEVVLLDVDDDVKVARRTTGEAMLAFAIQPQTLTCGDARWNLHGQLPLARDPAGAATGRAGLRDHAPGSAALAARL